MCSERAARRDSPQLFETGHSINSARVMNEITNCCPETASRHICRSEWVFLKSIDTTFVSRRRTFISSSGGRRTLIAKFADHPIESIGFGWIAVIRRGKFADRGLQSRNTDLRIGQLTRIDDLRHNPSVPDSAQLRNSRTYLPPPSIFRSRSTLSIPGTRVITNSTGRINITIGNSILIPALPTAASALKRRRVRNASAYTFSACARLVPNFSLWIIIAARLLMSSIPVRRTNWLKLFPRSCPARTCITTVANSLASSG